MSFLFKAWAVLANWECGNLQYGLCEINVVIIKAAVAAGVRGFCGCCDKSFLLSVKNEDGVVESFSTDMWAMTDYDKKQSFRNKKHLLWIENRH